MGALLPEVKTFADYRRIYRDEGVWLPAMRAICERHGLDTAALAFAPPGTHVVFCVEPDLYVKLFSPLWQADYSSERVALGALAQMRSDLPVPRLVADGWLEGWPYLVVTALPGVPVGQVWQQMDARDRLDVVTSCGSLLKALHATPTSGLGAIAVDWAALIGERIEARTRQAAEADLDPCWTRAVVSRLEGLPLTFEPVFLCADVTDEHVMVDKREGHWTFTGLIDFGDAMLGHPLYEFAAPGCCITRGSPALQRALLCAYGFAEQDLGRDLADQLMAYTLLHRYIRISDLLEMLEPNAPATLDGLQRVLWSLD